MALLAGQIATAEDLQLLQPQRYDAACTADTNPTTTILDITGATYTFTTRRDNARAHVVWMVDFDPNNTTAAIYVVFINVDGVDVTNPQAVFVNNTSVDNRAAGLPQQVTVTLPTAGSHTIKLRGQRASGSGSVDINATHTTMSIVVTEVV